MSDYKVDNERCNNSEYLVDLDGDIEMFYCEDCLRNASQSTNDDSDSKSNETYESLSSSEEEEGNR